MMNENNINVSEVEMTIHAIETLCEGDAVIVREEITKEDICDYMYLFPDDTRRIMKICDFLSDNYNSTETVEETSTASDSRKYNRMTKLDAENISKYIGEKCKGRSDIPRIIDDVYDYINGKFGKPTIRDLISGRTFTAISGRFFRMKNGKIVSTK